ncbi:hypothetical protein PENSPDRAFT_671233 [Peniophora sp. CONT]|nr:hypothetical protein PENSPDRAFT_671233 [Peniophora sp. CONT]
MPPRRNKSTPKAVAPPLSPPPAPARRTTRTKTTVDAKKPTPKATTKKTKNVDSDEVFASKSGGRGSLKYDGSSQEAVNVSDEGEEEVTPTPGPSKQKKGVPVKAQKVAGRRRVPPPPVKRAPKTVATRSRARRTAAAQPSDSDIEVVEDGTLKNDEGYESGAPSDDDGDVAKQPIAKKEEHVDEDGEEEQDDEEEGDGEEEEEEEEEEEANDGRSTDDDVDEDGNLKDLIDDDAEEEEEEEEEDDAMDVDEEEEPGEDGGEEGDEGSEEQDGDEAVSRGSTANTYIFSPLPVKISGPAKKKRTAVNLSDAEDMPATRKRRTAVANDVPKTITAVGHTSEVTLTMRDKKKQPVPKKKQQPAPKESAPKKSAQKNQLEPEKVPTQSDEVKAVTRKRKIVHVEIEAAETDKGKKKAVVKDKNIVKEALTGKGKSKQDTKPDEPKDEYADMEPQDRGCDVTHEDLQSGILLGSYKGLDPLVNHKLHFTNQPQTATLDIFLDKEQFNDAYQARDIVDLVKTREIPGACILNVARCANLRLVEKPSGSGTALCPKNAPAGELADIIVFGFVLSSTLIDGRSYQTPQGQTRVLKELEIMPVQQEFERLSAQLGMCTGGKIITVPVTEEGALTFSTKHTAVDEDGNPDKKKAGLGGKFLAKAPKITPRSIVHPDIVRRAREGCDTVPVFNSSANFMSMPEAGRTEARLKPEEVLTQRARTDPYYNAEIPQGSFVAVHSTVSLYTSARGQKAKFMSFNLLAVQIVAFPKDA